MKIKLRYGIGFLFVSLLGTFLHFAYDLSGESVFLAPFAAVNESTWEHLKLLVIPFFLYGLIERCFFKDVPKNHAATLSGALCGMMSITAIFYTYSGVLGFSLPAVNIAIFYLSVFFAFRRKVRMQSNGVLCSPRANVISVCGILLLILIFALFSFYPPALGIFRDPLAGA